jgi:hypothetical protein
MAIIDHHNYNRFNTLARRFLQCEVQLPPTISREKAAMLRKLGCVEESRRHQMVYTDSTEVRTFDYMIYINKAVGIK